MANLRLSYIVVLMLFFIVSVQMKAVDIALKIGVIPSDTTVNVNLRTILVEKQTVTQPLTYEERETYWREIRDLKKVYPYAKLVAITLIETYEYLQTLPEDERAAHLEKVKAEFRKEMQPKMEELTTRQGRILIKLIYRQTGSTGYDIVEAMVGSWKAWWWNVFAYFQGTDLKEKYDPKNNEQDAITERLVKLYDKGNL